MDAPAGLPLAAALRAATPITFPGLWIEESVLAGSAEDLFRRAAASGLAGLTASERRGRLPGVTGTVAEAVAARIMDAAGFSVFAQLIEIGARGADLIYLTPADNVLVLEVKGTLRPSAIPRLGRSRRKQMSAAWLNERNAPMLEWGLEAGDVYGAVMVIDLVAGSARVAAIVDHNAYFPVDDLASIDDLMAAVTIPLSIGRTAPILGRVDIDPIAESERRLEALLAGAEPDVPPDAAAAAVAASASRSSAPATFTPAATGRSSSSWSATASATPRSSRVSLVAPSPFSLRAGRTPANTSSSACAMLSGRCRTTGTATKTSSSTIRRPTAAPHEERSGRDQHGDCARGAERVLLAGGRAAFPTATGAAEGFAGFRLERKLEISRNSASMVQ
jgi:hypothetical protein